MLRVVLAIPLLLLAGCPKADDAVGPTANQAQKAEKADGLPDRDPALAHRLVEQDGAVLLDVRTPEEYAEGHVDGAVNIPHDALPSRISEVETLADSDKSTPIVVYCRSGHRAGIAKQSLLDAGFQRVTNLGGMSDW